VEVPFFAAPPEPSPSASSLPLARAYESVPPSLLARAYEAIE